jgi:hypothetical protein
MLVIFNAYTMQNLQWLDLASYNGPPHTGMSVYLSQNTIREHAQNDDVKVGESEGQSLLSQIIKRSSTQGMNDGILAELIGLQENQHDLERRLGLLEQAYSQAKSENKGLQEKNERWSYKYNKLIFASHTIKQTNQNCCDWIRYYQEQNKQYTIQAAIQREKDKKKISELESQLVEIKQHNVKSRKKCYGIL